MAQDERIETREYSQPLGTVFKVMFGYTLRRQWWWFAMTLAISAGFFCLSAVYGTDRLAGAFVMGGGFCLVLVALVPLRMYMKVSRVRRHLEARMNYIFTVDKIECWDSVGSKSEHPWTKFTFVREFAGHFMLHIAPQQYVLVPQSAFEPGDADRLRALLQAKGLLRN